MALTGWHGRDAGFAGMLLDKEGELLGAVDLFHTCTPLKGHAGPCAGRGAGPADRWRGGRNRPRINAAPSQRGVIGAPPCNWEFRGL